MHVCEHVFLLDCMSLKCVFTVVVGIDPELYELTTAKMETKSAGHSITDAFTKLIESMEKTTTARLDIHMHECTYISHFGVQKEFVH